MSETRVVKKSKKAFKISLLIVNVLVIAGLGFTSVFFFLKYRDAKNNNQTPEQRIVQYEKEIAKTYTLPVGDKPTLADVKSAAELKKDQNNKEFFKDAVDGDILLVYNNSKLGILYRPSAKKIIKAGPVAFKQQVAVQVIGVKVDREAAVALLKSAYANDVTIASESDAKELIEGDTIIVDVTGKNSELAKKIAETLKGKVGNVPEGQESPSKDTGIVVFAAPAKL